MHVLSSAPVTVLVNPLYLSGSVPSGRSPNRNQKHGLFAAGREKSSSMEAHFLEVSGSYSAVKIKS